MVAKPRANRRSIGELSFVLRGILDDIALGTSVTLDGHRNALALADAFARGDELAIARVRDAAIAVRVEKEDYGVHSPPFLKAVYWLPIEALLGMVESGDDASALVMTHANYAVPGLDWGARTKRIEALQRDASAHAAMLDDTPLPPKQKRVNARTVAIEAALLARSRSALGDSVRALFDSIRPARDPKRTVDRKKLGKLLATHGLPATEPILAFEDAFGGLLLPTSDLDDWREDGLWALVGPHAVMTSGYSQLPRGGALGTTKPLVPVARGPNDDVYFLDAEGRPYYHETIGERSAVPFGADGAELVTRLCVAVLTYEGNAWGGTPLTPPIARVPEVVRTLGLTRVVGDDGTFEAWASADTILATFRGMVFGVTRDAHRELER